MCSEHGRTKTLSILADVAPYSREYNTFRQKVGKQAQGNTELAIEYEKILERVRQTRESVVQTTDRHFTAPVDEIEGTVDSVSPGGLTLKEYPGRKFQFSSVGMSAADMTARIIGEQNKMTRAEAAKEVDRRRSELRKYLTDNLVSPSCRPTKTSRARGRSPPLSPRPVSGAWAPRPCICPAARSTALARQSSLRIGLFPIRNYAVFAAPFSGAVASRRKHPKDVGTSCSQSES